MIEIMKRINICFTEKQVNLSKNEIIVAGENVVDIVSKIINKFY